MTARQLVVSGGATPSELAALTSALDVVLAEAAVQPPGGLPAAYRSPWRRAALDEGVAADANPYPPRPGWGTT